MTRKSKKKMRGSSSLDERMSDMLGDDYKPVNKFRSDDEIDENGEEFAEQMKKLELTARGYGVYFNPRLDMTKIVKKFVRYSGNCICRISSPCPCPELTRDIKEKGVCRCRVFVSIEMKEAMENE